jgi:mono/diheme cytochrome c family protein
MMRKTMLAFTVLMLGVIRPVAAASGIDLDDATHIANGEKRFAQSCTYCHGAAGIGGKHKRLQCRDFRPDDVFHTITYGMESGSFFMPPWEDAFSEEKRWELVAYILSLGRLDSCEG